MKKVFYLIVLILGLAFHSSNAQDVEILSLSSNSDSCGFFSSTEMGMNVNFSGATSEYLSDGSVTLHFGDGTSSDAYYWGTGSFFVSHNYLTPGNYTVSAILNDASDEPIDTLTMTIQAMCKSIRVLEYYRMDLNCEFDYSVDAIMSTGSMVEIKKAGIVVGTASIGAHSQIDFPDAEFGVEYSFHLVSSLPGLNRVCESGTGFPYYFMLDTLTSFNNNIVLGYECEAGFTGFDMAGFMTGFLRFVEHSYLQISASNLSCDVEDAVVTLQISPKYNYVSSGFGIPPTSISGNTLTWNISDLGVASEAFYNWLVLEPAMVLTPGDTATHILTVTPISGDANPTNNVFEFTDSIRASYDPNNKLVTPSGDFSAGDKMTYTINFENLGNDTAWNIHILDVMDANLDLSTFKVLSSSHNFYYNFYDGIGGQKMLRVDFPSIHLPDVSRPDLNKGYIMYEVYAKDDLVIGDKIENTANIYFDINPAIITNTTVNTIPEPQSLEEIATNDGIRIFPNPTSGTVNVENNNNALSSIRIVNTLGQIVGNYNLQAGMNTLNIEHLSSGVYYLVIEGKDGLKSSKLVVK